MASTISRIRREVERRLADRFLPVLMEKLENSHARREFSRECDCSYCLTKRLATYNLKFCSHWGRTAMRADYRRQLRRHR